MLQQTKEDKAQTNALYSSFLPVGQWFADTPTQAREQERTRQDQEYVESLLNTVQTEARKLRQSRRSARIGWAAFGVVITLIAVGYCVRVARTGNWDVGDWWMNFYMFSGFWGVAAATKTHKKAASELTAIDDLRAVGPLAESLDIEEHDINAQVQTALIRLLPRLQSSDAALLDANSRACLNRALGGLNETFTLAILKAYEQIGDESALPFVDRLARGEAAAGKAMLEPSPRIIEAALECREFLRLRVERQRASQTLLRGASRLEAAPDTLLRAAQQTTTDPEQLLRAGAGPQS